MKPGFITSLILYIIINLIIHLYGCILKFKVTEYSLKYTAYVTLIFIPFILIFTYIFDNAKYNNQRKYLLSVMYFISVPVIYLWIRFYNFNAILLLDFENLSPLLLGTIIGLIFPYIHNKIKKSTRC